MTERDDITLLHDFAATESEAAFAALVERHVNLVYSTALRSVGGTHAAEEITQAVFIILARKAGKMLRRTVLSGWLYQTTRLTAANFLRGEIRRQNREQEAYMQSTLNEPGENIWPQIAPLLDDALAKLGERDRNAIVLRFFENKNLREVGTALGASEDAAKMRVNRALEKLRKFFTKRGVTLSATLIAGAVSANSVQAAPVGLALTISATAVKGAAVAATVTTLVKGTLKLMTYAKLKLAIGITAGILLAGGAATVAIPGNLSRSPSNDMQAITNLQQVLITTVFLKTPTANVDAVINDFTKPKITINPNAKMFRDLLKQHPDVDYLGSPRITTAPRGEAIASMTKSVQIDGTNTEVGIIVDVTPTVLPDSKISLKIRSELRELVDGMSPSVRVTKADEQTELFKSAETTIVIRKKIGDDGQTVGKNPNDGAETLLIFVNATLVKERLQNIIKRTSQ